MNNELASRGAAGRATLQILSSACGFGAIAIFVTLAQGAGASLLSILSWRYILGGAALGLVAAATRAATLDLSALRVAVFAGLGQSIIAVVSLSALRYIPAGTLAFLFYTYPAWVAIIARVRHSEPLSKIRLFALALSLAGIFIMVGAPGGRSLHPVGVTLALVAAMLYGAYIPMINALQRAMTPIATATYMAVGAAVILSITAAVRGELTTDLNVTAWRAIIGLALISTLGAFLLFLRGLRVLGPVRTAIISTVEPFFTAVLSAWLLRQPLTGSTLIGGAFIATAVVLLQLRSRSNGAA